MLPVATSIKSSSNTCETQRPPIQKAQIPARVYHDGNWMTKRRAVDDVPQLTMNKRVKYW